MISPVWKELSSSEGEIPLIAEFMVDMSKPNRKPPITAPRASSVMNRVGPEVRESVGADAGMGILGIAESGVRGLGGPALHRIPLPEAGARRTLPPSRPTRSPRRA
ncbi:hypothetical protein [Kocuria palustris]|uniref:hypothetical protein n=1 Tax=Kocuria palustris TaxID=71999 RepID=UPI0011A5267C|nr:hypothetical protein [Kocuria palustris]